MPTPGSYVSLSQYSSHELRTRSGELRQMAQTASTDDVEAALLRLADRFDALADERAAAKTDKD